MEQGKYIVIEGIPGVGKTAQAAELSRRLLAAGLPVCVVQEPDEVPAGTELPTLQTQHLVKSCRQNGAICIAERNFLTPLIRLRYLADQPTGALPGEAVQPDLCIVLDAPVTLLPEHDTGHLADTAQLERLRSGYLWEAKQRNLPVVFASASFDSAATDIWRLVTALLANRRTAPTSRAPVAPPPILTVGFGVPQAEIILPSVSRLAYAELLATPVAPYIQAAAGEQAFYTPIGLQGVAREKYRRHLEQLLKQANNLIAQAPQALQPRLTAAVLPVAVAKRLTIAAPAAQITEAAAALRLSPLAEVQAIAARLHLGGSKTKPAGSAEHLALPATYGIPPKVLIQLVRHTPRNELEAVADIVYVDSDRSIHELRAALDTVDYETKARLYTAYLQYVRTQRSPHDAVLDAMMFEWEGFTSFASCDHFLLQLRPATASWQPLSPRYGYAVPAYVEQAGLTDAYLDCFDTSLAAYSALQLTGDSAQYMALGGHRLRWRLSYSARQLLLAEDLPFHRRLREQLSERAPLLASAIMQPSPSDAGRSLTAAARLAKLVPS